MGSANPAGQNVNVNTQFQLSDKVTHTVQPGRPTGGRLARADKLKHGFREVPVLWCPVKGIKNAKQSPFSVCHFNAHLKINAALKWLTRVAVAGRKIRKAA